MSDKPILFGGPMVRALLAGTKIQTRRGGLTVPAYAERVVRTPGMLDHPRYWMAVGGGMSGGVSGVRLEVGDRLYVREHWRSYSLFDHLAPRDLPEGRVFYIADGLYEPKSRFRQAMHMPKWASRITLHVTEVRVQRLQDISEADARAEGIERLAVVGGTAFRDYGGGDGFNVKDPGSPARRSYQSLWDSINGRGSWEANPWVAAYTFDVELCNIDHARLAA